MLGVHGEYFDFIIAGAGTAGLVIASRLSEDPNVTVAVVEPGPDVRNDPEVYSTDFSFDVYNASINYVYPSIPQPQLGNRTLSYRAGKAIGGTSIVNGFVFIRGHPSQYDAWEELGNAGWNWDSLFSYGKQLEHFVVPDTAQVAAGAKYVAQDHGFTGPLTVSFPFDVSNSSFYAKITKTFKKLGLASIKDLEGPDPHGNALAPLTVNRDTSSRVSSASAYYQPVDTRTNLKIINGTVKRIVWANTTGLEAVADGVEYADPSGKLVTVHANKDVILSASVYRNPLILEGSGVGNPKILRRLGIQTKVDLPGVGESMQDHHALSTVYNTTTNIIGRTNHAALPTAQDVLGNKTVALSASLLASLPAMATTASQKTGGAISAAAFKKRFQVQHDLIFNKNVTIAELYPTNEGSYIIPQMWTTVPFSWGSIHLGAAGNIDEPVIDSGLLQFDIDTQLLEPILRLSRNAYTSVPLTDLVGAEISPGESVLPLNATSEQYATYIKENVGATVHVFGTCAMLPLELGGVVDSRVKVHGTANVRVVDASIIPVQLTGHPTAPIYAVAEKAAVLIKKDWDLN
ncbi:hypothetical protein N0V82_005111 [Gnomoniopsis sp. IMI 355080]|nr:hypothetical protein N0V82_005111 [Gnomoniopsis sp. IMI 355080]